MREFDKSSVVCFFGDSITDNGTWIRRIYDYYRNELKIPCKFYNCGVPGDRASNARYRMDETVFIYEPTDVVIAFGMNDVNIGLYGNQPVDERKTLERRRCIDTCIESVRIIAEKCRERGVNVIFCTPTAYDEMQICEMECLRGSAAALREIGGRIRSIAKEYGDNVVDFSGAFDALLMKLCRKNQTVVGPDRVHPMPEGHELMTQLFLKAQGFNVNVSDTYEDLYALSQRPHDSWEEERYELERSAKCDGYIKWDYCFGMRDFNAMDRVISARLPNETNPYIINKIKNFPKDREIAEEYRIKLKKHMENVVI